MTPEQASEKNRALCLMAPVVPVLVLDDAAQAKGLATALVAGGLPALEVTLRTPAALDAIREMAEVPGGVVGAGCLNAAILCRNSSQQRRMAARQRLKVSAHRSRKSAFAPQAGLA